MNSHVILILLLIFSAITAFCTFEWFINGMHTGMTLQFKQFCERFVTILALKLMNTSVYDHMVL